MKNDGLEQFGKHLINCFDDLAERFILFSELNESQKNEYPFLSSLSKEDLIEYKKLHKDMYENLYINFCKMIMKDGDLSLHYYPKRWEGDYKTNVDLKQLANDKRNGDLYDPSWIKKYSINEYLKEESDDSSK